MEIYKKLIIMILIILCILPATACRQKKFKEVNHKRTAERERRINYVEVYNVDFDSQKIGNGYNLYITFYVKNKSDKKIYWFQVLINIYSKGELTHSIIYTPNYYKRKGSDISYYRVLSPGQVAKMKIVLGSSYKIIKKPDIVKLIVFDAGDNIDIFKKIRVNPDKYFILYTPGD